MSEQIEGSKVEQADGWDAMSPGVALAFHAVLQRRVDAAAGPLDEAEADVFAAAYFAFQAAERVERMRGTPASGDHALAGGCARLRDHLLERAGLAGDTELMGILQRDAIPAPPRGVCSWCDGVFTAATEEELSAVLRDHITDACPAHPIHEIRRQRDEAVEACRAAHQCITDLVEVYSRDGARLVLDEAVKSLRDDAGKLVRAVVNKAGAQ